MSFNLTDEDLSLIYSKAETCLFDGNRIKFEFDRKWSSNFPKKSGVYAIYEGIDLLYIGETANLKERMKEVKRTYNHSFRKKLGKYRFGGVEIVKGKYSDTIENQMNDFYREKLYMSYIEVNFGRIEIESFLISKYQEILLNSQKLRK